MKEKQCEVYTRKLYYSSEIDTKSFQKPRFFRMFNMWSRASEEERKKELFVGLLNQLADEVADCLTDPTNDKLCNLRKTTAINCKKQWSSTSRKTL